MRELLVCLLLYTCLAHNENQKKEKEETAKGVSGTAKIGNNHSILKYYHHNSFPEAISEIKNYSFFFNRWYRDKSRMPFVLHPHQYGFIKYYNSLGFVQRLETANFGTLDRFNGSVLDLLSLLLTSSIGLSQLHQKGICHHDIKNDNILVSHNKYLFTPISLIGDLDAAEVLKVRDNLQEHPTRYHYENRSRSHTGATAFHSAAKAAVDKFKDGYIPTRNDAMSFLMALKYYCSEKSKTLQAETSKLVGTFHYSTMNDSQHLSLADLQREKEDGWKQFCSDGTRDTLYKAIEREDEVWKDNYSTQKSSIEKARGDGREVGLLQWHMTKVYKKELDRSVEFSFGFLLHLIADYNYWKWAGENTKGRKKWPKTGKVLLQLPRWNKLMKVEENKDDTTFSDPSKDRNASTVALFDGLMLRPKIQELLATRERRYNGDFYDALLKEVEKERLKAEIKKLVEEKRVWEAQEAKKVTAKKTTKKSPSTQNRFIESMNMNVPEPGKIEELKSKLTEAPKQSYATQMEFIASLDKHAPLVLSFLHTVVNPMLHTCSAMTSDLYAYSKGLFSSSTNQHSTKAFKDFRDTLNGTTKEALFSSFRTVSAYSNRLVDLIEQYTISQSTVTSITEEKKQNSALLNNYFKFLGAIRSVYSPSVSSEDKNQEVKETIESKGPISGSRENVKTTLNRLKTEEWDPESQGDSTPFANTPLPFFELPELDNEDQEEKIKTVQEEERKEGGVEVKEDLMDAGKKEKKKIELSPPVSSGEALKFQKNFLTMSIQVCDGIRQNLQDFTLTEETLQLDELSFSNHLLGSSPSFILSLLQFYVENVYDKIDSFSSLAVIRYLLVNKENPPTDSTRIDMAPFSSYVTLVSFFHSFFHKDSQGVSGNELREQDEGIRFDSSMSRGNLGFTSPRRSRYGASEKLNSHTSQSPSEARISSLNPSLFAASSRYNPQSSIYGQSSPSNALLLRDPSIITTPRGHTDRFFSQKSERSSTSIYKPRGKTNGKGLINRLANPRKNSQSVDDQQLESAIDDERPRGEISISSYTMNPRSLIDNLSSPRRPFISVNSPRAGNESGIDSDEDIGKYPLKSIENEIPQGVNDSMLSGSNRFRTGRLSFALEPTPQSRGPNRDKSGSTERNIDTSLSGPFRLARPSILSGADRLKTHTQSSHEDERSPKDNSAPSINPLYADVNTFFTSSLLPNTLSKLLLSYFLYPTISSRAISSVFYRNEQLPLTHQGCYTIFFRLEKIRNAIKTMKGNLPSADGLLAALKSQEVVATKQVSVATKPISVASPSRMKSERQVSYHRKKPSMVGRLCSSLFPCIFKDARSTREGTGQGKGVRGGRSHSRSEGNYSERVEKKGKSREEEEEKTDARYGGAVNLSVLSETVAGAPVGMKEVTAMTALDEMKWPEINKGEIEECEKYGDLFFTDKDYTTLLTNMYAVKYNLVEKELKKTTTTKKKKGNENKGAVFLDEMWLEARIDGLSRDLGLNKELLYFWDKSKAKV